MTRASASTEGLLEDIRELEQLDEARKEFLGWRDLARAALKQFAECIGKPDSEEAARWNMKIDLEEKALLVKALCRPGSDAAVVKPLLAKLRRQKIDAILGAGHKGTLFSEGSAQPTFLTAAYALDALASAPNAVFSAATVLNYYAVVRELYYPAAPGWMVGGARAGAGGHPTAFTTSQFVRAVFSVARMLERTGEYVGALAVMHQTAETKAPDWNRLDAQRRALSLHTTLAHRAWNLAFRIDKPVPPISADTDLPGFEAAVRHDLIAGLTASVKTFNDAYEAVEDYRNAERAAARTLDRRLRAAARTPDHEHLIKLSEGAHSVAARALKYAATQAAASLELFPGLIPKKGALLTATERQEFGSQLKKLAGKFAETAEGVRKVIGPARDYLSNVLDNQLARATAGTGGVAFEPFEMASAAATLGSAADMWGDERLLRAARFLGAAMTPEGFAIARPYHTGKGTYFQPSQPQILGAYAQLVEHVDAELTPGILHCIRQYFRENKRRIDDQRSSWRWDYAGKSAKHSPFHTAICATALDRMCRMLDRRINDRVLTHFTKKQPAKPLLQELFYPDYGLAAVLESDKTSTRLPIAVTLEWMRAHIAGVTLAAPYSDRLYSAVLHGPPGTGKTTLMEALAASARVRLVEVTPSDIVMGGAEAVERRADAVLRALSLLTDMVVLFDEFDPVLQTRDDQQGPQSIFTFLTTSMLPKLKRLYDSAKDRRVAFALATNVIRKLDRAAIRSGRFDATIGVYPPDLLSRYGRLYSEVRRYIQEANPVLPADLDQRFEDAVLQSYGTSMPQVGKRGWFTRPAVGEELQEDSLFGYLFIARTTLPMFSRPEEEQKKIDEERAAKKKDKQEDPWSPTERKERMKILELEDSKNDVGMKIRQIIKLGCRE
jgi:hypothetical protein